MCLFSKWESKQYSVEALIKQRIEMLPLKVGVRISTEAFHTPEYFVMCQAWYIVINATAQLLFVTWDIAD